MPSWLVLVAAAAGVITTSSTVALARARARRRFRALETAWRGYAEAKGMRLSIPSTWQALSAEGAPTLEAEVHGVAVVLTVETAWNGPVTRAEAALPGLSGDFLLAIRRRNGALDPGGLTEAITGNKPFDAAFALLSNEPDLARSILDRRLAHLVGAFPRDFVALTAAKNRLAIVWRGMELDAAVLDAAIGVVSTACRRRA